MHISKNKNRAFTLIELLVVIAIIAILTAIVTSNFTQSKAKARDAKRISDLAQIQLAFSLFFDRCNAYPVSLDFIPGTNPGYSIDQNSCPSGIWIGSYINLNQKYPVDPFSPSWSGNTYPVTTPPEQAYTYMTNHVNFPTDYVLRAKLETDSPALKDDMDVVPNFATESCDDEERYYCIGPE